ncbi:hypothetical protein BH11PSE11_BH11PSE11_38150 [soil metagenome]
MNTLTSQQLWQRLRESALVEGTMPPPEANATPWFVRTMLGIAGWIGALFLLGFVGLGFAFVMKSALAAMIVGGICCVAAWVIFNLARDNDFGIQFGLAVSLAGQAMVIFGLFDAFGSERTVAWFGVSIFLALLAVVVPNFLHRVLTSWGAVCALWFASSRLGIHVLVPALAAAGCAMIWLHELRVLQQSAQAAIWRPIGHGLVLGMLQIDAFNLLGHEFWPISGRDASAWLQLHAPWIGTALLALVLIWVVTRLLDRQQIALGCGAGVTALGAAVLVAALSFVAPGIGLALLILLLGFATGNKVLMGLGLLAMGGFVSHYYYQLHYTLLFKSAVLAISGVFLLSARLLLHRFFPDANAGRLNPGSVTEEKAVEIRENGNA